MPELPSLGSLGSEPDATAIVQALCDSIDRIAPRIDAEAIDRDHSIPPQLLEELYELGLAGLSLPVEHGGYGFGLWETGSVIAHLARTDRSVATTLGLHLGLGSRGLVRFGSDEQKERWLPRMATGELLAAFAATEPDAGSDLAHLHSRIQAEGDDLRVDGSKIYVTNGGLADLFTVPASSPGLGGARRGQSIVMLELGDPGFTVGAEEGKLGLRGSSTTDLSLDEVRVPGDRLLGEPGKGSEMLAHILAYGRTVMAAGCCGTGHAAMDAAHKQCAMRQQFGRPLEKLAVVAGQLALGDAQLFAMEALFRYAAWLPEQLGTRSLAAKVLCSEGSWELADLAVQLHGGSGYIEETGVALLLRDARITRIFEGANDVLRIHLGLIGSTIGAPRDELAEHGALGLAADAFATDVAAKVVQTKETLGLRLGGAHVALHRLGSLLALRMSCDAVVLRALDEATPAAEAHAERWLAHCRGVAMPLLAAEVKVPARRRRSRVEAAVSA